MVLGDHEDTIREQPSLISANDNNVKIKTPKKVEYWCYQEVKSVLRERIHYLESELLRKDHQISELLSRSTEVREIVQPSTSSKEPVGRKNPVKVLAQMEAKDRESYWKKEIERREKMIKEEGNATTPETTN